MPTFFAPTSLAAQKKRDLLTMFTGWGKYPNVSRENRAQCSMGCACPRCQHRDAPLLFPLLSFPSTTLPRHRPFLPQMVCRSKFIWPFTCCSGSKNVKDGCGVNKERSFRTLTSLQVLFVGLNRRGMDRVKWRCHWKSCTAATLSGVVARRRRREMMTLPCIAAKDRAQTTWWKGDKRQEFFDWAAHMA